MLTMKIEQIMKTVNIERVDPRWLSGSENYFKKIEQKEMKIS
ncbi:hypothetical protein [Alkalihalobacillus deserti]|nr:hypothetical protein [Alkalihalobacillus deserti]